jgi:hypothetical protein
MWLNIKHIPEPLSLKCKLMEVHGDGATQYGNSERCIMSLSLRSRDRTLKYSDNDLYSALHSVHRFSLCIVDLLLALIKRSCAVLAGWEDQCLTSTPTIHTYSFLDKSVIQTIHCHIWQHTIKQFQMGNIRHNVPCHTKHLLVLVCEWRRGSILKAGWEQKLCTVRVIFIWLVPPTSTALQSQFTWKTKHFPFHSFLYNFMISCWY